MSVSIPPVSDPYPTPLVDGTQSATDRQRAREDANRRRQPHHQGAPQPDAPQPQEPDASPTIGTLIDVRA
jgi:hypothetical protein